MFRYVLWAFLFLNIFAFGYGIMTGGDIWPWNGLAILAILAALAFSDE